MRARLFLVALLYIGQAEAKDGYPSSETEKTIIDMFLLGFNAEANCKDLDFDIDAIENLRSAAGLPDTIFRVNGSNGAYVLRRNSALYDDFKGNPAQACAMAYDALGPGKMNPPIVRKRR